ncbi:MAG: hypothetical protein QMD92_00315, partial [bacterium]|nr:hypothetical protein [bacterium]
GSLSWILTMIRSGIKYPFGYGYWGPNGHDGIWHIALSNSLSRGSLENPVFSGEILKNYHLGFDIILAFLHKLTSIQISILYFQVLPVIFSLLVGILVYKYVCLWRESKNEALWATFFVYFGCGFGFIVTFLRDGIFTGESMFWSQQSFSTLVNPPFALSLIFVLSGLIFLLKYLKDPSIKYYLLAIIIFGLLIQIKAYAAILILGGLFFASIYTFLKSKNFSIFKVLLGSLFLNLFLYLLFKSDGVTNVFVWQPFWFLETLMSYSDRFGWERFYSAMTTYRMGELWLKASLSYGIAFIIFLIGNMGLRVVGFLLFIKIFKNKIKINGFLVLMVSMVFIAVLIPMFFVQNGTPWNTIQFFYYYLFFFSIFAGISISWLVEKSKPLIKTVSTLLILIFMVLGAWSTLQHYLPKLPQSMVSNKEYDALSFLASKPIGVVLTYPFDKYKAREAENFPPRPLYLYDSTAYVSAFTNKPVFLEDEVNLNIMGYRWKDRLLEIENWYKEKDQVKARDFLKINNITYVYWLKGQRAFFGEGQLGLTKIFENSTVDIFQVE